MTITNRYKLRIPKEVVAHWCNPEVKPASAMRNLRRDIGKIPGMLSRLEALGYSRYQRYFTYAQAKLLNEHYCGSEEMETSTQLLWTAFGQHPNAEDMS